jgi:hypothetical protein
MAEGEGSQPAEAQGVAAQPTVVHTFPDEEAMAEFTTRWQHQQDIRLRISLLQAYWNQEQGRFTQLNQRLTDEYHMDIAKNYVLDPDRRMLIEQPASTSAESDVPQSP